MQSPYNDQAVRLLHQIGKPAIRDLIGWLVANRNKNETVHAEHWTETKWHVYVRDTRVATQPASWVIGFSVDVAAGVVLWRTDRKYTGNGGMTFLRSLRWFRLLRKKFPKAEKGVHYDDYRATSGVAA